MIVPVILAALGLFAYGTATKTKKRGNYWVEDRKGYLHIAPHHQTEEYDYLSKRLARVASSTQSASTPPGMMVVQLSDLPPTATGTDVKSMQTAIDEAKKSGLFVLVNLYQPLVAVAGRDAALGMSTLYPKTGYNSSNYVPGTQWAILYEPAMVTTVGGITAIEDLDAGPPTIGEEVGGLPFMSDSLIREFGIVNLSNRQVVSKLGDGTYQIAPWAHAYDPPSSILASSLLQGAVGNSFVLTKPVYSKRQRPLIKLVPLWLPGEQPSGAGLATYAGATALAAVRQLAAQGWKILLPSVGMLRQSGVSVGAELAVGGESWVEERLGALYIRPRYAPRLLNHDLAQKMMVSSDSVAMAGATAILGRLSPMPPPRFIDSAAYWAEGWRRRGYAILVSLQDANVLVAAQYPQQTQRLSYARQSAPLVVLALPLLS